MRKIPLVITLLTYVLTGVILPKEGEPAVQFKYSPSRITFDDPLGVISEFQNRFELKTDKTDTLRILAVRVEFSPDDVATTTGDGLFDLSSESDYRFDRPPHDRTYFQHQLIALANYFEHASNGRLVLQSDVFPAGEREAYRLSRDMVYYSGQEDEKRQKVRWTELLEDALKLAYARDTLDFAGYDVFIVFHAGVGSDFDFDFDPTPYDVQSVFIDFETLKEVSGADDPDYPGIDIGNGFYVREGIILPETQNQNDYDLALLGTMTLLFGSQLGMPSLFDTETGRAGIGRWGLMDQGSYNFQGHIPAFPCAWSKVFMGWQEPVVITDMTDVHIGVSGQESVPIIVKIPVNASEYFLIENRQRDWDGNGVTFGWDFDGKRVQFDSTGKVLAEDDFGVLTRIQEYDYGLPGSGLLIWHIDERVIRQNLTSNTINNDRAYRGVDLIECDGAQDLGYFYSLLDAGYGTESGDYYDPYWAGNESHKIVNNSDKVEFSPVSIPNTRANDGGETQIRLYDISEKANIMSFSVTSGLVQSGFETSKYAGAGMDDGFLLSVNLEGGTSTALVAARNDGKIIGWTSNGKRLIASENAIFLRDVRGLLVKHDFALVAAAADSIRVPPASSDIDGDGDEDIVAVDEKGVIYIWTLDDRDDDGLADLLAGAETAVQPSSGPMILNGTIVVGTTDGDLLLCRYVGEEELSIQTVNLTDSRITGYARIDRHSDHFVVCSADGQIFSVSENGELNWQTAVYGVSGDYKVLAFSAEDYDGPRLIAVSPQGRFTNITRDGVIHSTFDSVQPVESPGLGDIDGDGIPEILMLSEGQLHVMYLTGVTAIDFPAKLFESAGMVTDFVVTPLFIKSPLSDESIVVSATADGLIHALNRSARSEPGFPLSTSSNTVATPVLTDLDHDNDLELAVITQDGFLHVYDLGYETVESYLFWTQYGADNNRSFHYRDTKRYAPKAGGLLLPPQRVFCYPNPSEGDRTVIRYSLTSRARDAAIRIYDLAGELVTEFNGIALEPGDHEVLWDLSGVQSGVYLARVEAVDGSGEFVEFVKIAVVK